MNLKEAKERIKELEAELENYNSKKTLAKLYLSVKKKSDQISDLLYDTEIDARSLDDKNDRFMDRVLKFMEKAKQLSETLVYLKEQLDPEIFDSIEKEDGSFFEEIFDEMNNG